MPVDSVSPQQPSSQSTSFEVPSYAFLQAMNDAQNAREAEAVAPGAGTLPDSFEDRLKEVITKAAAKLPHEAGQQLLGLIEPKALAILAGVLATWGGAHLFGAGEIADVGMLVLGWAALGGVGLQALGEFGQFAKQLVTARTSADLDGAAGHLARGVSIVGVQGSLAFLFKSAPSVLRAVRGAARAKAAAVQSRAKPALPGAGKLPEDAPPNSPAEAAEPNRAMPPDPAFANALRPRIEEAVAAYRAGDYQKAEQLLTDKEFAQSIGLDLNVQSVLVHADPRTLTPEDIHQITMMARANSMSWNKKVDVVDSLFLKDGVPLGDAPAVAKRLTPIMLEEWMHQLQNASGRPISKLTEQYLAERNLKWGPDHHELDIIASFYEWGFPVDDLGTANAYPERIAFENWYRSKQGH